MASYAATGQFCTLLPAPAQPEILASCKVSASGKNVEIQLVGKKPNKVSEIWFRPTGRNPVPQVLKLTAAPLIDPETVSVMFVDFNFDGHKDFAIMPSIQTSENVKYLYFLYDTKTRKYQASPEMAPIVNPEVNGSEKHIRSYWRETPTRSGWHFWKWKNNRPYIDSRIEQRP